MKLLLISALLLVAGVSGSYGQCAVAICSQTGAWGAGYNGGNEHYTDEEYRQFALKSCADNGGTSCKIVGISNDAGWWALATGRKANGDLVAGGSQGQPSESAARADALKKYKDAGGINPDNLKMLAWRVYPKGS